MALKEYIGLARLTEVLGYLKNYIDSHSGAVTAGTGLTKTNDVMSVKEFASGDMADIVAPLPSTPTRGINYSTEEQVIGTWIDGKPIYQKTIDCGYLPNYNGTQSPKYIEVPTPGLKDVVDIEGVAIERTQNDMNSLPIPHISTSGAHIMVYTYTKTDTLGICFGLTSDRQDYIAYVTVRYTKTTD